MPIVPLGFPEYGMTNANDFRRGIPPAETSKVCKKEGIYRNNTAAKTVLKLSLGLPEYGMTIGNICSPVSKPQRVRKGTLI